jgi:ribosomal protein S18 acetylase RimI-like enzyme
MFEIRAATVADAAIIIAHRRAMFLDMGRPDDVDMETMKRNFEPWVTRMIGEGKYLAWITEDGGRPIASASLLILDWPPNTHDPAGEHRGYVLNVFVDPEYRRRGLARALIERCMDEAHRRRIRTVALHSSDMGRALYEALGFSATQEMQHVEPSGE